MRSTTKRTWTIERRIGYTGWSVTHRPTCLVFWTSSKAQARRDIASGYYLREIGKALAVESAGRRDWYVDPISNVAHLYRVGCAGGRGSCRSRRSSCACLARNLPGGSNAGPCKAPRLGSSANGSSSLTGSRLHRRTIVAWESDLTLQGSLECRTNAWTAAPGAQLASSGEAGRCLLRDGYCPTVPEVPAVGRFAAIPVGGSPSTCGRCLPPTGHSGNLGAMPSTAGFKALRT